MMYVSSEISTGLSSKSVFLLATVTLDVSVAYAELCDFNHSRCANLSSFPIVAVMPLPICAAFLANSDLDRFPPGTCQFAPPSAALRCASVRSACLCPPTLVEDCFFCAWFRMDLNSLVRSCIEVVTMVAEGNGWEKIEKGCADLCLGVC